MCEWIDNWYQKRCEGTRKELQIEFQTVEIYGVKMLKEWKKENNISAEVLNYGSWGERNDGQPVKRWIDQGDFNGDVTGVCTCSLKKEEEEMTKNVTNTSYTYNWWKKWYVALNPTLILIFNLIVLQLFYDEIFLWHIFCLDIWDFSFHIFDTYQKMDFSFSLCWAYFSFIIVGRHYNWHACLPITAHRWDDFLLSSCIRLLVSCTGLSISLQHLFDLLIFHLVDL
jgi:hypothetical protein